MKSSIKLLTAAIAIFLIAGLLFSTAAIAHPKHPPGPAKKDIKAWIESKKAWIESKLNKQLKPHPLPVPNIQPTVPPGPPDAPVPPKRHFPVPPKAHFPVPPKARLLVALATVLEKTETSIKIVGPRLKVPIVILVDDNTVIKKRGKKLSFSDVTEGSWIVVMAKREETNWKAKRIIILQGGALRKMRISIKGTIEAINVAEKAITIQVKRRRTISPITLKVTEDTSIRKDNQKVTLDELAVDDRVNAHYRVVDGELIAVKIRAKSPK